MRPQNVQHTVKRRVLFAVPHARLLAQVPACKSVCADVDVVSRTYPLEACQALLLFQHAPLFDGDVLLIAVNCC